MNHDVFHSIAFDERLVTPGREQAREAYKLLNGVAPEAVRRELGRDVLVKIAKEYHLGTVTDQAAETDVPGTPSNPY